MSKDKNFIKLLIKSNFMNMLRNKDIRAIEEFRNNPNSIHSLIAAMGGEQEILQSPAHLQMIEELVGEVLGNLEEALTDTKADCGYSVGFDEKDTLTVKIESFATQDNFKLSILKDSYNFESSYVYSGRGSGKKIVYGDTKQKQLLIFEDQDFIDGKTNSGKKLMLDDFGFVIDELDATKATAYKNIPGSYNREKVESKKGSHISRDGANVTTRKSSVLAWNGDALHLNDEEEEKAEVYKRAIRNTVKCPNVQKYYEDTLGISLEKMIEDSKVQG